MNIEHLVMGIVGYSKDIEPYMVQILAYYLNGSLERNLELGLNFRNGYFGKYSNQIYEELSACVGLGWISTTIFVENDRPITQYNLSSKGLEVLAEIEQIEPLMKRIKAILR